jgi:hypothetical protein
MFSDAHRVVTKTYLAIDLSRIVFLPENIQKLFVRDFRRIVFQLHSFRVPCGTTAHFAVCWIHCLAPSVTDCRLYHPQPPYAPQCQRLEPHHLFPLQKVCNKCANFWSLSFWRFVSLLSRKKWQYLSNTGNSLERQFHAPETPGCKCSLLLLLRHLH